MIIDYFIFGIIIFISPFIISKFFQLNNYKGYLAGLSCILCLIGTLIGLSFVLTIIIVIFLSIVSAKSIILISTVLIVLLLLSVIGVIILFYILNLYFMKQIKDEIKNAYIFMYISGYYLINGIFMFLSSFQEKKKGYSNPNFPDYINQILKNPLINYIDYCLIATQFGILVCIFFKLKKNNKSLIYISLGIYFGMIIILTIAILIDSIIIFCAVFLIALFSLIFGIYLYIKYEKEDKIPQIGNTNTGNLV